eukprot:scaffold166790_cov26-Tisochrysis_lutea.AAC.1
MKGLGQGRRCAPVCGRRCWRCAASICPRCREAACSRPGARNTRSPAQRSTPNPCAMIPLPPPRVSLVSVPPFSCSRNVPSH